MSGPTTHGTIHSYLTPYTLIHPIVVNIRYWWSVVESGTTLNRSLSWREGVWRKGMKGFEKGGSWRTKFNVSLTSVNSQKVNIYKDIRVLVQLQTLVVSSMAEDTQTFNWISNVKLMYELWQLNSRTDVKSRVTYLLALYGCETWFLKFG